MVHLWADIVYWAPFWAVYFVVTMYTTIMPGGGGAVILGILGSFVPPSAIIPLHSVLAMNGNVARTFHRWRDINWPFMKPILVGLAVGVVLGGSLNQLLPDAWIHYGLGSMMVLMTWMPDTQKETSTLAKWGLAVGNGFLSSAFGLGALLLGVLRRQPWSKNVRMATMSATFMALSAGKTAWFLATGFSFRPYLIMLAGALLLGWLAVKIGVGLFDKMSENQFNVFSKWIVTCVGINFLRQALMGV